MAPKKPVGSRKRNGRKAAEIDSSISFDLRRNLINVLGEEHYPYAEFLYHELAANAYDEDATEVQIVEESVQAPAPGQPALYDIIVSDNGNGMDLGGLREYFTVGESGKPQRQVSERLGRPLIGRIGVGKVAILKVARRWRLTTERHLSLDEPVRLRVEVDVDEWISGRLGGFPVERVEPTGKAGTEIVLQDVSTRLREDRILRHLQRLPLGDDFMVWRNGQPVPPRRWHGIHKHDIDLIAEWEDEEGQHSERIVGELWIRPDAPKPEQAYLKEPTSEREGLRRDAAGIEVRVNGDMICREFFGHESHGHQINRIWGWVEVPWLPILGNRTDYLRDSPAGHAFIDAVKPIFTDAYNKIRYERDRRAQERRRKREAEGTGEAVTASEEGASATQEEEPDVALEALASRYGGALNRLLQDHPEFAPVVEQRAETRRGRPAHDRIYPVRPADGAKPFELDPYGSDIAIVEEQRNGSRRTATGSVRRIEAPESPPRTVGEIKINTTAGIKLQFRELGGLEAPYRWSLEDPENLALDVNTDHKLYKELMELDRPGGPIHRLHCAWIIALALAERANPTAGQQLADVVESMSFELYEQWTPRARTRG
jgi:hypothetical protein